MSVLEDGEERSYKLAGWHDSRSYRDGRGLGEVWIRFCCIMMS